MLGTPGSKSMNTTPPAGFDDASRADARASAQHGLAALARAFNHCDLAEVAHRYADDVQARFFALATELVALVEHGTIEVNPAHALHLKARAARGDKTLQAVIRRASRKTPIRGR